MRHRKPIASFAPQETLRFTLPLTLASIIVLICLSAEGTLSHTASEAHLITFGIFGSIYVLLSNVLIMRTAYLREFYGWGLAILTGVGLGILAFIIPEPLGEFSHILIIFGVVSIATVFGRYHAYTTLIGLILISISRFMPTLSRTEGVLDYFSPILIAFVLTETIVQIKDITHQHIHRLETINKASHQIMQSLDTKQTLSLLDKTIKETLNADTYFIGLVRENELCLDLFYDDGEYFNNIRIPLDGTLSGWVIKNQRELFLPDLRDDVQMEGIGTVVIGKDKTSLSWLGVPLRASNVNGIIALASYQPNAFNRADLELLSNLAQHAALALDNAIQHKKVEEQARLDSLTGVFNHGYFLKRLAEQAEEALRNNKPLSLIMLDIDYFKQYNDTYGHLVGDQILHSLATIIKQHVKETDAVGRWGGEEFAVSLPGATGAQALEVAHRISNSMAKVHVEDRHQKTVPAPTISQGIAVFPVEANEIYALIDLADCRLYVAKERGRNQIEPTADNWDIIKTNSPKLS
ncbi:MAG TPA: sensor domain-containing diguanylate cyclase [Anaerolineales bacterium]|nr:sensor domain-containing diguanylate cyclase [Anaerolineales bacterium]